MDRAKLVTLLEFYAAYHTPKRVENVVYDQFLLFGHDARVSPITMDDAKAHAAWMATEAVTFLQIDEEPQAMREEWLIKDLLKRDADRIEKAQRWLGCIQGILAPRVDGALAPLQRIVYRHVCGDGGRQDSGHSRKRQRRRAAPSQRSVAARRYFFAHNRALQPSKVAA